MTKNQTSRKGTKTYTGADMTLEEFTRAVHIIGIATTQEIIRLVTETDWPAAKIHRRVMARMDKEAAVRRARALKRKGK
jgi:hypothetical protein